MIDVVGVHMGRYWGQLWSGMPTNYRIGSSSIMLRAQRKYSYLIVDEEHMNLYADRGVLDIMLAHYTKRATDRYQVLYADRIYHYGRLYYPHNDAYDDLGWHPIASYAIRRNMRHFLVYRSGAWRLITKPDSALKLYALNHLQPISSVPDLALIDPL